MATKFMFTYTKLPGVMVTMVPHPTENDPEGCDGLYIDKVIIVNQKKFQYYCDCTAQPWYKFSGN